MTNQNDFIKQLSELLDYAKAKDNRISKKEIRDYFSDMKLTDEQLNLVYEYMAEHNVEVSGFSEKKQDDKMSEEDSRYLRIYRKEIRQLPVRTKEEMEEIYLRLAKGDETVLSMAIESHLKQVITLATKYRNRGVLLEDLIQEGNIALIQTINDLYGNEEMDHHKKEIDRCLRACMIEMVDDAQAVAGLENTILAKTNLILEATRVLAEDLGRVANIHELAEFTKMTEEEITDLADLALDEIKIGACHHEH